MHPGEETLMSFASGESDLPQCALVEGHLGVCASCRALIGELVYAGGALLRAAGAMGPLPAVAAVDESDTGDRGVAAPALWDRVLRRVETLRQPLPAVPPERRPRRRREFPLPAAVRGELSAPGEEQEVRWHWAMSPGVWYADLARDPATGSVLLGGYLPPGRRFPEHLHLGPESVLVLAGGYADHLGRYEAGDYTMYPPGSRHQPATDPDEGCWSLVRVEKPNLLLGWRGWFQRRI